MQSFKQFEFQKLGPPTVENKFVDLNVALKAFTIIDGDGVRILEHHPIDVISFASPGREVSWAIIMDDFFYTREIVMWVFLLIFSSNSWR